MDAVLQKIKADIFSRPAISALILITIVAASTLLTLATATLINLDSPYDQSFQELKGAHLWLYFNRDKIRARDVKRIETLPGVIASTGLQYSVDSRVRLGDIRVWTSLRAMPETMPPVNQLLVQEGRYLLPNRPEILASKDLNDIYQLALGDPVGIIRADGKEVELPVIGLAYNPTWDIYRNQQPPYLYLDEKNFREMFPDEADWDWSLGLRLAAPASVDETVTAIEAVLRPDALDSYTDWRDVRTSAIFGAQLSFIFLGAFSLFAILATLLVIASSVSSIVLSQFKQIGMLKAIGFTRNQILSLYTGQYLVLALIGSPIGLLIGIFLAPIPLRSVAASLARPFHPSVHPLLIALVLGITAGVVIIATLGAAYRGARANIIKAIAVGAEPPRRNLSWSIRFATWLGLPLVLIMGLNETFARPFRSALTCLNLCVGVIGIVFGLTLNEAIEVYIADPALLGIVYDAAVTREQISPGRTWRLLSRAPGVRAFYAEDLVEAETLTGQSFQLRVVDGQITDFPFSIAQGRFFEPGAQEMMAGQGLLDWLGLSVGDELTLVLEDERDRPVSWRIVGQYAEPENAGQMAMAGWPAVARTVKSLDPTTYYLKLEKNSNSYQLKRYLQPRSDSDLNLILLDEAIPHSIIYLQLGIFALSAILIAIALVNVFNTSLLAVQEKLRTVGVLKTVGMTPLQVVVMVNTTAGFLGLLATMAGIPLGLIFTKSLLDTMSRSYGIGQVEVPFNVPYLALLVPLMVLLSMAGSLLPGWQAARLSIVQVLRRE